MKITPGKLAGLKKVSNDRGVIAAAAMRVPCPTLSLDQIRPPAMRALYSKAEHPAMKLIGLLDECQRVDLKIVSGDKRI